VGEQVGAQIEQITNIDTRVTVLGHIQRGGAPSPFDRVLAARMAAETVRVLADMSKDDPRYLTIGLRGNEIVTQTLEQAKAELDLPWERPRDQWYLPYLDLVRKM